MVEVNMVTKRRDAMVKKHLGKYIDDGADQ